MEQKITLIFKKDLTKLAGNPFGQKTYEEQVKGKVDLTQKINFIIPSAIDRVASSFIQGFFSEIVDEIGIVGIEELIDFESSIPDFKDFVLENLE